ncbi:MAG: glutamate--tRNA ligase [candidate division Zixibacteria bacterium]
MNEVRVRIAPSPSGFLHIGTARSALFNWLYARRHGGKFLLRIEDTDTERSSKEMIDVIFESLKWLGLDWDEEPVYQSQRIDLYREHVDRLLESGRAYPCWCKPEVLKAKQQEAMKSKQNPRYDRTCYNLPEDEKKKLIDSGEKYATRLFIDDGATTFDDLVVGTVTKEHKELDDFIIARSDGRAVYNMAVVVDDHDMRISHVIRGNDHVSNTFKQILIYKALDIEPPKFAHIPLILGKDRSKMSKRDGAAGVTDYGRMGYLKEAVVNFIALLGWSPGDDREVMTIDEIIESFSLERISTANAIFDTEKLRWMNGEYIRACDNHKLVDLIRPFMVESGLVTQLWINSRWDWMMRYVSIFKERCQLLPEFAEQGRFFFADRIEFDHKGVEKHFNKEGVPALLGKWIDVLGGMEDFTVEKLEGALRGLAETLEVKPAALIHPTRLALSGETKGPPLFDMMELLGPEKCLERLKRAREFIKNSGERA